MAGEAAQYEFSSSFTHVGLSKVPVRLAALVYSQNTSETFRLIRYCVLRAWAVAKREPSAS